MLRGVKSRQPTFDPVSQHRGYAKSRLHALQPNPGRFLAMSEARFCPLEAVSSEIREFGYAQSEAKDRDRS